MNQEEKEILLKQGFAERLNKKRNPGQIQRGDRFDVWGRVETCCFCEHTLITVSDLYDPFPLETDIEKFCCKTCFQEKVVPLRLEMVRRAHKE